MFEGRKIDELVQIVVAGGGFVINAGPRRTDELVQIAVAASKKGARVTFNGLGGRQIGEIVQIAVAGKGCIVFGD